MTDEFDPFLTQTTANPRLEAQDLYARQVQLEYERDQLQEKLKKEDIDSVERQTAEDRLREIDAKLATVKADLGRFSDALVDRAATTPDDPSGKGCSPKLLGVITLIIAMIFVGIFTLNSNDDDKEDDEASASEEEEEPEEVEEEEEEPAPAEPEDEEPEEEEPEEDPPEADYAPPPSEAALPPGAILYQGSSGAAIGCIPCDGQFRHLPIDADGISVGPGGIEEQQIPWEHTGRIVEFGATLSGSNQGRYGINVMINGDEYRLGCALEIGQTGCHVPLNSIEDLPISEGDLVHVQVGEGGNVAEKGESSITWWFVFQPEEGNPA